MFLVMARKVTPLSKKSQLPKFISENLEIWYKDS
jgi:hypothetical protein